MLKNPDKKEEILKNQRKADFMAQRQKERQEKNRQEQVKKGIIREKGTTKTQPRENYQKVQERYKQKAQGAKLRDRARAAKQSKSLSESYQPRKVTKKVDTSLKDKKKSKPTQDKLPSGIEVERKNKIKSKVGKVL